MDIFIGVLANAALVLAGSFTGLALRKVKRVEAIGERIIQAFSVFVMVMGIQGMDISQPIKYLICLLIGITIGEILDLDKAFNKLGQWLQKKIPGKGEGSIAEGFVSATLIFCIGSMTFLGAIESGISHTHTIYIAKGIIDAVTALSLAVGAGIGVALSAGAVIVYQGILVLLASLLGNILAAETIAMCVSVGSLLLVLIGFNLLGVTGVKVANMIPAMFVPMLLQIFGL